MQTVRENGMLQVHRKQYANSQREWNATSSQKIVCKQSEKMEYYKFMANSMQTVRENEMVQIQEKQYANSQRK